MSSSSVLVSSSGFSMYNIVSSANGDIFTSFPVFSPHDDGEVMCLP